MRKDMTPSSSQPETIRRLINDTVFSLAMLAGIQLNVFDALDGDPMTAEQVAAVLHVRPDRLRPLLYALVAAGLMVVEGERFANSPEASRYLVSGKPEYLGFNHASMASWWTELLGTAASIRTGTPQHRVDYANASPEELETLYSRFYPAAFKAGEELVRRYDFTRFRSLADVGGGSGGLSIAVTEACPHIKATILELPTAFPLTTRLIERANAAERVQVQAVDVIMGPLRGNFDVVVLRDFIQVLTVEQASRALKNVGRVVIPGGTIIIWSNGVLSDSLLFPVNALRFGLSAVNRWDEGGAYTESQHRMWLADAGFEGFTWEVLPSGESIITAKRSD
jgi:SAM-dependent methyltransferase